MSFLSHGVRNEISSSKEEGRKPPLTLYQHKSRGGAPIIEPEQRKKNGQARWWRGKNQSPWQLVRVGGSPEIEAKGGGQGSWIIMLLVLVETRLNAGE